MIRSHLHLLAPVLMAALAPGCADPDGRPEDAHASGTESEIARELDELVLHVDAMQTLAVGIRDVAAARSAAPRMMALVEELREREARVEALSTPEIYESERERYRVAGASLRSYRESMSRLAAEELMDPELGEAWLLFLTR